jgi:hypothetical protein
MILHATGLASSGLMMLWNLIATFRLSQPTAFCRQIKSLIYAVLMKRRLSLTELSDFPLISLMPLCLALIRADLFFVAGPDFGHGKQQSVVSHTVPKISPYWQQVPF